eukprot:UN02174
MLKDHVERELLTGLSVESRLVLKEGIHQQTMNVFRSMLSPVFNRRSINDLFDPAGKKHQLSATILKMYTMETFLYRSLTKAQREEDKSKFLTFGPFNELFNKSLERASTDNDVRELYRP